MAKAKQIQQVPKVHVAYEYIVVGAGISGLWMARELRRKYPTATIALAERYKGLGGRTYSYWPPEFEGVHWEMGAGRIRKDHHMVMDLLREYGLTYIPIGSDVDFLSGPQGNLEPADFESTYVPLFFEPLTALSPTTLATHTLEQLLNRIFFSSQIKHVLERFPYRAEVTTLRADLGLKSFLGDGEMGSHKGYGVLKEGFSELVNRMKADLESKGVVILNRHRLMNLKAAGGAETDLQFDYGFKGERQRPITLRATKACILALHRDAIAELPAFRSWKTLSLLKTAPLLRTYMIFDGDPVWFADLKRIVTPGPLRYILPMNPKQGTIMISYTDDDDTAKWKRILDSKGEDALGKAILAEVRALFPDRHIPQYKFFRSHYWETGCTYWCPGTYDPAVESDKACHPLPSALPGVWLCGESWSMRQAWVEGALEHAQKCLSKIRVD